MKKLSVWAKNHKQSARIAIVISFLLIITTGIITGTLLNELGIIIPASALIVILCIYFISFLAYPSLRQKTKIAADRFYQWQKICDFTLALSGFLIIVYVSNGDFRALRNIPVQNAAAASSTSLPGDSSQKTYKSISAFSASLKNEEGKKLRLKERKKLLKEQVKAIKNSTDMSKGGKIALIILSVIVALGLLSLVASLACGLSCNGSAAGAILVAIGGTALVVYLLVITIRAINGKKRKKALAEEEPPKTSQ
ncbi:hypothetical protein CAP36_09995 [Chitinophagaceae bacterium IBVUCB2]|nr:hypothetical protein CAP36_09995 [Chitinophagaceae bacterium IBVUCB2]